MSLKRSLLLNAKNTIGWRTSRKFIVFAVDDYGNVRLHSKGARKAMDEAGMKVYNRFDAYDTLETREDLEALFETLGAVKDENGRHPVFTPFAVPCNIDFEAMRDNGYEDYQYELLTETYSKLSAIDPPAYEGAWDLWKKGMRQGLMVPQFHGREHLNLKLFREKLQKRDPELITALENRSYTSISSGEYDTISPTAAFDFDKREENRDFHDVIQTGLDAFEEVYGYRSNHFIAPRGQEHPDTHPMLLEGGISYIDTPLLKKEHQGGGKYKTVFNYTGKVNSCGQHFIVRNVVFEPTDERGLDWVEFTLKQIEAAFRWNRPAVISSHRVNFCGHIEEENRKIGLAALRKLLLKVMERWPEVEFISSNELGDLISGRFRDSSTAMYEGHSGNASLN
ncbi:MAG: hypothetical protein JJU46_10460 [Balneolaceae bacterium]|nr:hypothetical protein [Balneolaceae bacterium]MCH8549471.1 NgoMIV family type II restriction endonuclease [Balneolaceae bacterium]